MKVIQKIFLLIVSLFLILTTYAQQELWTIDGRIVPILNYETDNEYYEIKFMLSNGKLTSESIDNVFSIKSQNDELVIFKPDSISNISIADMREYVLGAQVARNEYKPKLHFWGGVAIGAASFITIKQLNQNTFFAPIIPASYVTIINYTKAGRQLPSKYGLDNNNLHKVNGFYSVVKNKQFLNSLLGSGVGMALGIVVNSVVE